MDARCAPPAFQRMIENNLRLVGIGKLGTIIAIKWEGAAMTHPKRARYLRAAQP